MKKTNINSAMAKDLIWETTHNKIKILNPQDFTVPGVIDVLVDKYHLDLNSLGLADSKEIKKRLKVTKLLFDQEVRERVDIFHDFFFNNRELPQDEDSFLDQYENDVGYFCFVGFNKLG